MGVDLPSDPDFVASEIAKIRKKYHKLTDISFQI